MWHMTGDTWHVTQCLEDIGTKGWLNEWMNELMNETGDCRTALATLGLLKSVLGTHDQHVKEILVMGYVYFKTLVIQIESPYPYVSQILIL